MAERQRTDFADLVRDQRAQLGISLRELERRAVDPDTGERAKYGWISKVERGLPVDTPSAVQIRALAAGLSLPVRAVQEAVAAQFLDVVSEVWSEDRKARVLVARIEEMSPEDRDQIIALAEMSAEERAQLLVVARTFGGSRHTP